MLRWLEMVVDHTTAVVAVASLKVVLVPMGLVVQDLAAVGVGLPTASANLPVLEALAPLASLSFTFSIRAYVLMGQYDGLDLDNLEDK
jgi:hypothetical protein